MVQTKARFLKTSIEGMQGALSLFPVVNSFLVALRAILVACCYLVVVVLLYLFHG